jgi:uncharacterized membrane protein
LINQIAHQEKSGQHRIEKLWSLLGRGVLRHTHIRSHPRLLGSTAVGLLLYLVVPPWTGAGAGFLIAFDGGALTFLAAVWVMMARATPDSMRHRAELEDEGRYTVLAFGTAAASAVLVAIVLELHGSKNADSAGFHIVLAAATILLSWFFMNTTFALHYAHGYYGNADHTETISLSGDWPFPASQIRIIGTSYIFLLSLA